MNILNFKTDLKNKKPQSPNPETGRKLRFIRFELNYESYSG
ncbi:hypothetical protein LEP1GSC021_1969 [Leptospira noguchii str. 1993005606]|uniref:Uncharacterized protein n=3 Tax=Leptospira noguchii TaxID=28182 RepID=M6XYA0_9LEPT|nr:hypothetical protein LEP1GSC041_1551 [Leptospira noguchii str. 2006001870]EMI61170.1 hypothetical protein LEP1GSC072_3686 [Leptospira noguchii str. Bonito]EMM99965.1 hypothetical protein LEP1GSC035_3596 [Leptospira noguchii str. 2007001578]EMO25918.1 hypothetical protein LEP1GSC170_3377 [Leptospira interrogans serovar Bataviae str. HAI135]EMO40043.1 hypothetical protein LEP1GSC186_1385 [Leptospira noguchii serovar Autumnalis str. ZUN142]EMO87032.1 hypothetical protein LEP1GSC024_0512 [Lepto